jgi:D-glucosaminate-6-phosphate ammonia-lyase
MASIAGGHREAMISMAVTVEGSHIGRRLQGAISGTVDGDRVRLRSSLPTEGTQLTYRFDGRIQGQTIEGQVSPGEYGKARWTARRVGQASV